MQRDKIFIAGLLLITLIITSCVEKPKVIYDNPLDPLGENYTPPSSPSPFYANKVAAAWYHTLAIKSDGTLWATGYNGYGQLGTGDTTTRDSFVQVLSAASAVAAGEAHTLAIKSDGTLWATGRNKYGQLGTGDTVDRSSFVQVLSAVSAVAAGMYHTLAIKSDGTLWATGRNNYGQLGTGDNNDRNSFVQIIMK